jgi:hypothetical protein
MDHDLLDALRCRERTWCQQQRIAGLGLRLGESPGHAASRSTFGCQRIARQDPLIKYRLSIPNIDMIYM